jgi:hypothetical protein
MFALLREGVYLRNAMKKSKSLFGRLNNGGLYLRHPVDAGGAFADVHIEKSPVKVHQSRLKLCALSALGGNKNNCVNLCNLWLKIDQSKITNYAKRTQFSKKSNVYNRNFNNELQRKMDNGHLVKTNPNEPNSKPKQTQSNPNEPNFIRHFVWRVYPPSAKKWRSQ